jgi:hypothetical protein
MNKAEKQLLIEIMSNVDDLISALTAGQFLKLERGVNKIRGNYHNLLEGVKDEKDNPT